jgi:hypothetical protein
MGIINRMPIGFRLAARSGMDASAAQAAAYSMPPLL